MGAKQSKNIILQQQQQTYGSSSHENTQEFDPRSPSIKRTPQPIHNDTWDPRSPSKCVPRTPVDTTNDEIGESMDPRSPSCARTPLDNNPLSDKILYDDSPYQTPEIPKKKIVKKKAQPTNKENIANFC